MAVARAARGAQLSSNLELFARPVTFRPIHYLGSKLRLVTPIIEAIDQLAPESGPVCDLFAGSGTVSLALAQVRPVIAADIQRYSSVLCNAVLDPIRASHGRIDDFVTEARTAPLTAALFEAMQPLIEFERDSLNATSTGKHERACDLLEHGSVVGALGGELESVSAELRSKLSKSISRLKKSGLLNSVDSAVARYFGGVYFSYAQAVQLDALLHIAHKRKHPAWLAAVLSTASDLVNTVGNHFAQPLRPRDSAGKPKIHLLRKAVSDRSVDGFSSYALWMRKYAGISGVHGSSVIRGDFREVLRALSGQRVAAIYADPPYTRDHYSRYYHVLETMCLRDNPSVSTVRIGSEDRISRGVYRQDRHQSPFCIKSQAPGAFSDLFAGVKALGAPLLLSYSPYSEESRGRPRLMTVPDIEGLAKRYFRKVKTKQIRAIAHSKLNHSSLNTTVSYGAEVLITCEP